MTHETAHRPGAPSPAEKRGFPRVPVRLVAHCRIGTRHLKDPVADLSRGGLHLVTEQAAPVGTPVRMAVALPAEDGADICTLVGAVAWRDVDAQGRQRGLGVAFEAGSIDPTALKYLSGFLAARSA